MSRAEELLRAYLRHRVGLGERDLHLERHTAAEVWRLLARRDVVDGSARTTPALDRGASPAPPRREGGVPTEANAPRSAGGLAVLDLVRDEAVACTRCRLAASRTQVVFGEGNPSADLVVVGEAPGADEDASGRPFVGRAGKLLNVLLASVGFPREEVYICNVLKCRPPGNRNPQADEVEACSPYLVRQVELVGPRVVLACGSFAAQTLLQSNIPIGKLRGSVHRFQDVPLIATYHPAALLRNPAWVRSAWEDLQLLRQVFDTSREAAG